MTGSVPEVWCGSPPDVTCDLVGAGANLFECSSLCASGFGPCGLSAEQCASASPTPVFKEDRSELNALPIVLSCLGVVGLGCLIALVVRRRRTLQIHVKEHGAPNQATAPIGRQAVWLARCPKENPSDLYAL